MNLSLFNYDGAGTMAGCRNGVAAQLLANAPSAHLTFNLQPSLIKDDRPLSRTAN